MNHETPSMHERVHQDLGEISGNTSTFGIPESTRSTQTADINGERLAVDVSVSEKGYEQKHTGVTASVNPIDELGTVPEPFIPGNDVDLGLGRTKAEISQTNEHDGSVASRATIKTPQGLYIARESKYALTDTTHVERPGYGLVEIKNPRARKLVASLAGKAILETQAGIQEVVGKEFVQDRGWLKTARRGFRRATGKPTQKAA